MLILSGVSINAIVGDNGILTKAKDATMKNRVASLIEQIDIYKASQAIDEKTGLDLYPLKKDDTGTAVTLTTKLQSGEISLSSIKSELKNYLVRKATQIDSGLIANVNDLQMYKYYYYIDEDLIPAVADFKGKVVLLIGMSDYMVISLDGYDWGGSGSNSYALKVADTTSASEEMTTYSSFYAAGNNTYKLSGTGKLTVVGERTEQIANLLGEEFQTGKKELDLVFIAEKYSIPTTTTANPNFDCIGKNGSGNKVYVKQLMIETMNEGSTVYIIDVNNDLWAWGFSGYNKLALGVNGNVPEPTKLLQGVKEGGNQIKAQKVWANGAITAVLTTSNNIYMAGSNVKCLLGQGDEESYSTWVQPTVYIPTEEELAGEDPVDVPKEEENFEIIKGKMDGSNLKNIFLGRQGSNSEISIFILYENGKCLWRGQSSQGISGPTGTKWPKSKRYIDITEYFNYHIEDVLGETYSTANIKDIQRAWTTTFYMFDDGTCLSSGWAASACHGDETTRPDYLVDMNENLIDNVKGMTGRDFILTDDNLYYTRTEEYDEGTMHMKKWHFKGLALSSKPTDFSFSDAWILGENAFMSNDKAYRPIYNPYDLTLTLEEVEELSNKNIVENKSILNFSYINVNTAKLGSIDDWKYVCCTANDKFYVKNCDEIYIGEDKNIYQALDLGFDDTIYVSSDSEGIDILTENYDYIENLNKDSKINLVDSGAFVSKIVSTPTAKFLLYNNSADGSNYIKYKGLKTSGIAIEEFEDTLEFDRLNANIDDPKNIKKVFSANYVKTSSIRTWISSSVFITEDNEIYWAGSWSGGGIGFRCVPGCVATSDDLNVMPYGVRTYYFTKYPVLVNNDVLSEIADKIDDVAMSKFAVEGGVDSQSSIFLTTDGKIYVYGNNAATNGFGAEMTNFQELNLGEKVKKIYSADGLNFAITEKGNVFSWGYDYYNLTGAGRTNLATPYKLSLSNVYYLTIGEGFAIYATENGKVYGIGRNEYGQLGTGNNQAATTFVECVGLEK